jgi:carboxypeptidase C (cathepsin A)
MGAFDGRVTALDTGIAASIGGKNDPAQMAVEGVYTAMWHVYLNDELKFSSTSPFMAQNDKAGGPNWDWRHIDPTRANVSDNLYTAADLAAAMELNPYLKVFSASGYYDAVTPFFQTFRNFVDMPLGSQDESGNALRSFTISNYKSGHLRNLTICNYESGHMVYLDNKSRSEMKKDLAIFYEVSAPPKPKAAIQIKPGKVRIRRIGRTPY